MKKLLLAFMIALGGLFASACGRSSGPLVIWVGSEVQAFYTAKMEEYVEYYNANNDSPFPYEVEVRAADTGTAAGVFLNDIDAGPDILTVAHDNLGRLISGAGAIRPIQSEALLAQIQDQNPDTFLNVIRAERDGVTYTFGVPYEAQSLVLYYNTAHLSEEDVLTWEGIWAKAEELNTRALAITGTDGFNNSFLVLAQFADTGEFVTRLYEEGQLENTELVNDAAISVMRWGQRFFGDTHGARQASDSGWEVDLANGDVLSVISGAWHFRGAQDALGDDLGIALLPQFTLTEADVYGDIAPGTVMQSGTFTDTKMFVINRHSRKVDYLEDVLLFLTHKDVQEESFLAANTLPAYKNAVEEFEGMDGDDLATLLTTVQLEMFQHGKPQPFGVQARFNTYYYQRQAPDRLYAALRNTDGDFTDVEALIEELEAIERIWRNE